MFRRRDRRLTRSNVTKKKTLLELNYEWINTHWNLIPILWVVSKTKRSISTAEIPIEKVSLPFVVYINN